MISSTQHTPVSEPANRFAILSIGQHDNTSPWAKSPALHNTDLRLLSGGTGNMEAAQLHITALNEGYDALFIAGFGSGATDALMLAERFPDHVHGVLLFDPEIHQSVLSVAVDRMNSAITAAGRLVSDQFSRFFVQPEPRTNDDDGTSRLDLGAITQSVLIFHPRAGGNADIKVAAALQRELGGPVEVQFVGPGADVEAIDVMDSALIQRCANFTARVAAGAEGRRAKRQQAASRAAAVTTPSAQKLKTAPRPTRLSPGLALAAANAAP